MSGQELWRHALIGSMTSDLNGYGEWFTNLLALVAFLLYGTLPSWFYIIN
jgi:hypothetical protein